MHDLDVHSISIAIMVLRLEQVPGDSSISNRGGLISVN